MWNKTEGNPEGKTKTNIQDFEITEYVTKQMPYVYLLKKMLEISFPDKTNAGTLKVSNRQTSLQHALLHSIAGYLQKGKGKANQAHCSIGRLLISFKGKFHYASWFEAGRRQVRSQIP